MTVILVVIFLAVWLRLAWNYDPHERELLELIDRAQRPERIARNLDRRWWW